MRAVVQRVARASVAVDGRVVGAIGRGFLVLLGVTASDDGPEAGAVAAKIAGLRVFADAEGRMNLALADVGGEVLAVSQFTLYADVSRGNRPSFVQAARPEQAEPLYGLFCAGLAARGLRVEKGVFGARMEVDLVNDGPVTVIVDSDVLKTRPRPE